MWFGDQPLQVPRAHDRSSAGLVKTSADESVPLRAEGQRNDDCLGNSEFERVDVESIQFPHMHEAAHSEKLPASVSQSLPRGVVGQERAPVLRKEQERVGARSTQIPNAQEG